MTRFAPPTLYQCPACAGYFKRSVLTSFHYYDDVPEWSDGMSGQWWAGSSSPVGKCSACRRVVWIDDATALMPAPKEPHPIGAIARLWHQVTRDRDGSLQDEREWNALPGAIKAAERFDSLQDVQDLVNALALLTAGAVDREVHLRRRLWWVSKDHQRLHADGTPVAAPPTVPPADVSMNMHRLLALFESDPSKQVERGELLRQLGRFDEAVAVLKAVKPDGHSEVKASKIQRWAQAHITELQDLAAPYSASANGLSRRVPGSTNPHGEGLPTTTPRRVW